MNELGNGIMIRDHRKLLSLVGSRWWTCINDDGMPVLASLRLVPPLSWTTRMRVSSHALSPPGGEPDAHHPPHQYVIARRVERAKQLLESGADLPLAEVAAHAGFSDQSQFSHHFKPLVGVTPGRFRTPARIA